MQKRKTPIKENSKNGKSIVDIDQSNRFQRFIKNPIIQGLIVGSFLAMIGFFIWMYQYSIAKKETNQNDIQAAYLSFTNNSTKAINYSYSRDKFIVLQMIEYFQLIDSVNQAQTQNTKNDLYNLAIKRTQLRVPELSDQYFKALEFQGEYISSCNSAKLFFGDLVSSKIDTLSILLSDELISKIVTDNNEMRAGKFNEVSEDNLARFAVNIRKQIQQDIILLMEEKISKK